MPEQTSGGATCGGLFGVVGFGCGAGEGFGAVSSVGASVGAGFGSTAAVALVVVVVVVAAGDVATAAAAFGFAGETALATTPNSASIITKKTATPPATHASVFDPALAAGIGSCCGYDAGADHCGCDCGGDH